MPLRLQLLEDTSNDARLLCNPPPACRGLYVSNLAQVRGEINAELRHRRLDGAFTKYWRRSRRSGQAHAAPGLHVWSHYRQLGQDNTDVDQQRPQHLHRLVEHRRWRRPQLRTQCNAATAAISPLYGYYNLLAHGSVGATPSPVRPAGGNRRRVYRALT
jgi:hypothetical protein